MALGNTYVDEALFRWHPAHAPAIVTQKEAARLPAAHVILQEGLNTVGMTIRNLHQQHGKEGQNQETPWCLWP